MTERTRSHFLALSLSTPQLLQVSLETIPRNLFPGVFCLSLWNREVLYLSTCPSYTFKTQFSTLDLSGYRSVVPSVWLCSDLVPCCVSALRLFNSCNSLNAVFLISLFSTPVACPFQSWKCNGYWLHSHWSCSFVSAEIKSCSCSSTGDTERIPYLVTWFDEAGEKSSTLKRFTCE